MNLKLLVNLLIAGAFTMPAYTQDLKQAPFEVYDAYNTVLAGMKFPAVDAHIGIADTTLNTGCGETSGNPVLMNNCGMFIPPATADGIYAEARKAMPTLSPETWSDLVQQNRLSVHLKDNFLTPFKHRLSDLKSKASGPWAQPNAFLFLSNVGFDKKHNQALLYVQVFSYMSHVPTGGDLFLLTLTPNNKWQVDGRLTLIQMGSDPEGGAKA